MVTPENLETFMDVVVKGLHDLEDSVSRIASFVINELETIRLQDCIASYTFFLIMPPPATHKIKN